MPVDGKVHFVLYRLKKQPCCFGVLVVVKGCCVQVGNFLIKFPLRQADFPDILQLAVKVFICEHMALFQTFLIHRPALDRIILHDLPRPLSELDSPLIVHLESDSDNHLEVIVIQIA